MIREKRELINKIKHFHTSSTASDPPSPQGEGLTLEAENAELKRQMENMSIQLNQAEGKGIVQFGDVAKTVQFLVASEWECHYLKQVQICNRK